MLHFSRIVAAAVEVIDYEYYGNMVSGEECSEVGGHHDEGGAVFRHQRVGDGVVLLFATSSFDRCI